MADKNILLVEGKDDLHVLCALLERYQFPEVFEVQEKGGVDNLLETLPIELKRSDLAALGIVVDADTDLTARWSRLRSIISRAGEAAVPNRPDANGTILALRRPDRLVRIGVWLMPDNQLPGMLEHFIEFLVPEDDALWPRAVRSVEQIPQKQRRFHSTHEQKANVHTWLAWQEDPGTPLGQAIMKRYLIAQSPEARILMDWLRRLFVTGGRQDGSQGLQSLRSATQN